MMVRNASDGPRTRSGAWASVAVGDMVAVCVGACVVGTSRAVDVTVGVRVGTLVGGTNDGEGARVVGSVVANTASAEGEGIAVGVAAGVGVQAVRKTDNTTIPGTNTRWRCMTVKCSAESVAKAEPPLQAFPSVQTGVHPI